MIETTDVLERVLLKLVSGKGVDNGEGFFPADQIVVFGAGHLGRAVLKAALQAGLNIRAIADNNQTLWGSRILDIPVLSPVEAVARHNDNAVFVVAIYNGSKPRRQLADSGCKRICPFPLFYWHYWDFFPSGNGLALPDQILSSTEAMRQGYALLDEEASRQEFAAQIEWRCSLNYECLPSPRPGEDTYYPRGLANLSSEEVLVDCGAFDGDSINMFLGKTSGFFRHIYAIEPDPVNRSALSAYLTSLSGGKADQVTILPFGVGARNEVVSFNVTGTAGSSITSSSGATVECRRLDDILTGPEPTFIKMDIEGAEPEAIRGAAKTILRARPILAICAYHKCEHLWELPVLIKQALPEYRLFLRRYAEECWEMVYYAIPPERIITANDGTPAYVR